eukprot:PhM_4_TR17854/c1_g1_i1/m.14110
MADNDTKFLLKEVVFHGKLFRIVQQNENGPCPMIAIANILTLRGSISWPAGTFALTVDEILNVLVNHAYEVSQRPREGVDSGLQEHMLNDVVQTLPLLRWGMDLNVRFRGVEDYEFTSAMVVLELLRIRLLHGWVVDPQDRELVQALGSKGYNQLQDLFLEDTSAMRPQPTETEPNDSNENVPAPSSSPNPPLTDSQKEKKKKEKEILNEFLSTTQSQMTTHGLFQLVQSVAEGELSMLFRANHFAVLTKHKGRLHTLVTDVGYMRHPNAVWERITDADGNSEFVDEGFYAPGERPAPAPAPVIARPLPPAGGVYARPVQQSTGYHGLPRQASAPVAGNSGRVSIHQPGLDRGNPQRPRPSSVPKRSKNKKSDCLVM